MAIPGVPLKITDSDIVAALRKHLGVVRKAAVELDISHNKLYDLIYKDNRLEEVLQECRSKYHQQKLDNAELCLDVIVNNMKTRPDLSLRASMYTLDRLGKKRGYVSSKDTEAQASVTDEFKELHEKMMQKIADSHSERKIDNNSIKEETRS